MTPFPVPKVPTNNLYKFAAIAGTVFMIGVFTVWARVGQELMHTAHEFRKVYDVLHMKHAFILSEANHLGLSFADLQQHHPDDYTDPKKKRIEQDWEQLREAWLPMLAEKNYVDYFVRLYWVITGACVLLEGFGLWVATWGYRHWYRRVQVHEDARAARASLVSAEDLGKASTEGEPN